MAEMIFIGTSSGLTDANRFHSSLFLKEENAGLLIDAGDGVSKALLNAGIEFDETDGVLISHTHADHLAGVAALITQMIILRRKKPLTIFIYKEYEKQLSDFLTFSILFPEVFSFELNIHGFEFNEEINAAKEGFLSCIASP